MKAKFYLRTVERQGWIQSTIWFSFLTLRAQRKGNYFLEVTQQGPNPGAPDSRPGALCTPARLSVLYTRLSRLQHYGCFGLCLWGSWSCAGCLTTSLGFPRSLQEHPHPGATPTFISRHFHKCPLKGKSTLVGNQCFTHILIFKIPKAVVFFIRGSFLPL